MKVLAFKNKTGKMRVLDITTSEQRCTVYRDLLMDAIRNKYVRAGYDTTAKGLVDASRRLLSEKFNEKQADVLEQFINDCVDIPLEFNQVEVGTIWPRGSFGLKVVSGTSVGSSKAEQQS